MIADPATTGGSVVLVTSDGRARALSARDLSPAGAWPLDAPLPDPPAAAGGRCFLADTAGNVRRSVPTASGSGRPGWGVTAAVVVARAVRGRAVWFLGRDGALLGRSLDDGSPLADAAPSTSPPRAGPSPRATTWPSPSASGPSGCSRSGDEGPAAEKPQGF